jgi:hypothetical protein
MQYAALLGKASRIASIAYKEVSPRNKKHTLYHNLTGKAMTWLKYQWTEDDIIAYLLQHYIQQPVAVKSADSVSFRSSYRRKTQRIKRDRRRKKPIQERVHKTDVLFTVNYYQRLHQRLRRKVNEQIDSYSWAE